MGCFYSEVSIKITTFTPKFYRMDQPVKKLFLLDAYALIYRAFFAMSKRPALNSKGVNTSAVMGFLNTLYDVLRNE